MTDEWATLSAEEKSRALKILVKNLETTKYIQQQELSAEQSLSEPNQGVVREYTNIIATNESKISYFKSEIARLSGADQ